MFGELWGKECFQGGVDGLLGVDVTGGNKDWSDIGQYAGLFVTGDRADVKTGALFDHNAGDVEFDIGFIGQQLGGFFWVFQGQIGRASCRERV